MRIPLLVFAAACALHAQQARADMYADCNNSCNPAVQLAQCRRITALPDRHPQEYAAAYSHICVIYLKARAYTQVMLDACRHSVKFYPTPTGYANLGTAEIRVGFYRSAIENLTRGTVSTPTPSTQELSVLYYNLAIAHDRRHERKTALAYAKQAQQYGDATAYRLVKMLVRPQLPARR